MAQTDTNALPHVVIVGGGFGGLNAAITLRKKPVKITLIDRTNHHLFQPLLYQVAMAGLSPAEIASPIRAVLSGQKNLRVLMGEVTRVDLAGKKLSMGDDELSFDHLILALGTRTHYFGHDEWESVAPGLKTLEDAVEIRRRVLTAFESAEREQDASRRQELLTFVVIGGGATGVEMAGAIAELSRTVLATDFRSINPKLTRVVMLEGGPTILGTFDEKLRSRAIDQLLELGVEVRLNAKVTRMDEHGVFVGPEHIRAATILWAAGIAGTQLARSLGVPLDRIGRVITEKDMSLPGHPDVYAIGDMACYEHDENGTLPGLCPAAIQAGRYVGASVLATIEKRERPSFKYWDKGTMATIGRSRAIAQSGNVKVTGFLAWLMWLFVHLWFLVGFRNRFVVFFNWAWSYFTYARGARLITGTSRRNVPVLASAVSKEHTVEKATGTTAERTPETATARASV